jgi:hypothetical protein
LTQRDQGRDFMKSNEASGGNAVEFFADPRNVERSTPAATSAGVRFRTR